MNIFKDRKQIVTYLLLLIIVLFNLYLYRSEFTVLSDPNDNIFHYALIDEAKNVWKNIFAGKMSVFSIFDSWNERWSEGFALSSYYSHLPEAFIALVSFIVPISTFKLFVIIRTVTLIILPVSFFLAARILGLSNIFGLALAFFSQAIFTDGLYGIDSSSFIWRGWGLAAQLFAVFFLPLAFAYTIDYLENNRHLGKAVLFNFLVAQSHFGLLLILMIAYPVYFIFSFFASLKDWQIYLKRQLILIGLVMTSLLYFILPFFWQSNYRNFSYWDPIWKFDSWGIKQIITWLFNGDLFDFKRIPIITWLILIGIFYSIKSKLKLFPYLVSLFFIYLVLFFGRTSLGSVVDLIPGFSEYHLHRVIIMLQFVGLFIAAWFFEKILQTFQNLYKSFSGALKLHEQKQTFRILTVVVTALFSLIVLWKTEKPLVDYAKDNQKMIVSANERYRQDYQDYKIIINSLVKLPVARVYAGKPGNWGREFKLGDTQIYMALSQDGYRTVGFLPESWSPNSDPEEFFDESNQKFYDLYQVGYLVTPSDKQVPPFAKLVIKQGKFALYQIVTSDWYSQGRSSWLVIGKKTDLLNITRFWFASQFLGRDYPQISFSEKQLPGKKILKMIDINQSTYGSIWQANPFITNEREQSNDDSMWVKYNEQVLTNGYQASIKLKQDCQNCLLVLKQTYHPNWQVKLNGQRVGIFPVFPFFIGIPVAKSGQYTVQAQYHPNGLKIFLILAEIIIFAVIVIKQPKV